VLALELRKGGAPYREIARTLHVDLHTAHGDIAAELAALRDKTHEHAEQLRDLELQRLDRMTEGLWPQILKGSPPAVSAGVRVSERRSRLVGLDAPTTSKTEVTASAVVMDPRLAEFKAAMNVLDLSELEEVQRESDRMIDEVLARARARRLWLSTPTPTLPAATVENAVTVAPTEPTTASEVTAIESPADDSDDDATR
jgi:hypothetical protein